VRRSEFNDNKAGVSDDALIFGSGGANNLADIAESLFARNSAAGSAGAMSLYEKGDFTTIWVRLPAGH